MTYRKRLFAIALVLFAFHLSSSAGKLHAHDVDVVSRSYAASQTFKQKCIDACRDRYQDCRRLKQLPSAECRNVYQDCTHYTCTGRGPG